MGSNTDRKEAICQCTKPIQKNKAERLKAITFAITNWMTDNSMRSNREKSNIDITILEKLPDWKCAKNYLNFGCTNNIFVDCRTEKSFAISKFWIPMTQDNGFIFAH